jgi:hypothetical protein
MAQRKIFDCDRCPALDIKDPVRVSAGVSRDMDGAGSMETTTDDAELCGKCAGEALSKLLNDGPFERAKEWFHANKTKTIRR